MKLRSMGQRLVLDFEHGERMPTAAEFCFAYDNEYELRKKGIRREEHMLAYDINGRKVRDHYLPHIPIDAQVYARTWKAISAIAKAHGVEPHEAWAKYALPAIENEAKKGKQR